jgi:hypothetical protein
MEPLPFDLPPEYRGLLHALARETGKDIPGLIAEALEALEEKHRAVATPHVGKSPAAVAQALLAIGKQCAAGLHGKPPVDHGDFLYDARGLPQ